MSDSSSAEQASIFISYKHKAEPDQTVVDHVILALEPHHTIFIDKKILPSLEWGKWIQERISESDFLIVFLTAQSARSEMVRAEIQLAHEMAQKGDGNPKIIPIRLAWYEDFDYPLSAYLNHIQWAEWDSEADTPRLIEQLRQAIAGQSVIFEPAQTRTDQTQADQFTEPPPPTPSAQPKWLDPTKLDSPEGTIDPQSAFYLVRESDSAALEAIQRQGVTITIKGPRQMGKSSLLIRTLETAINAGKRAVFLDYQLVERATLTDADEFYRRFCDWVTDELEMDNRVDEFWASRLGNNQCCTRYFSRYLLKELNQPLVLAMDEVENLFDTAFRSDFFSMLRSWHNSRANIATPIWKQLDLVLVTSTEPYQLIENLNQSPFNVGEVINLEDFTPAQVADLNQRYKSPLNAGEEQRLMQLLGGHPYLTRRALYLITTGRISVTELFAKATDDRGPFGDHLRYHLFRMHNKQELIKGLCDALLRNTCDDETIFFRLRGAGLVKRAGQTVRPRCQLYTDFFLEHLKCQQR
jgi:AAA-like domain/TIR domain